jgi:site-specific DNA-cytosine methylase
MREQPKRIDEADEKKVVAPLRLLELFSGTGSIGRAFETQGWEVISIDTDPQAQATFRQDISRWDCASLLGKKIDVIWASPCTNYSALRKSTEDERLGSDELVRRTLEIAKTFWETHQFS